MRAREESDDKNKKIIWNALMIRGEEEKRNSSNLEVSSGCIRAEGQRDCSQSYPEQNERSRHIKARIPRDIAKHRNKEEDENGKKRAAEQWKLNGGLNTPESNTSRSRTCSQKDDEEEEDEQQRQDDSELVARQQEQHSQEEEEAEKEEREGLLCG